MAKIGLGLDMNDIFPALRLELVSGETIQLREYTGQGYGVSRKIVSKLANERGLITPDMALRLSRAFGTSPDRWMNLQKNYDLWQASTRSGDWKRVQPIKLSGHIHGSA